MGFSPLDALLAGTASPAWTATLAAALLVMVLGTVLILALRRQRRALLAALGQTTREQALLAHQARYDALTDLPNRSLLLERLAGTLRQARYRRWEVGVLFVNLDRFKTISDTLGHENGDLIMVEVAARLSRSVGAAEFVARAGGDEFVVVVPEIGLQGDVARIARQITETIRAPFRVDGHEVFVTASVGVALCAGGDMDAEALVGNASAAMLSAKRAGGGSWQLYAPAMNARAMESLLVESGLRHALERQEFVLHFQPRSHLASRRVMAFEALLRWQRPGKGLVMPAEFIPLLEASGMIVAVGEWVIRAACAQIRDWQRAGLAPVTVAVNVSARQFLHSDLYAVIDRALCEYGIDAALLEIEITESDAMHDPARAAEMLRLISARGVRVAVDDFGTGYSSIGYLKRFPIDFVKLDRSFVVGLPLNEDDVSIARAVIGMAHSLGLQIIAEGVETEAQRAFLARNGCDEMQGYLVARPMPAAECAAFLSRFPAAVAA